MPTTAALSNYPLYTGDTTGFNIIANDSGETTTYTVTKETLLVGLATTGSNTFKGTQTHSGSIIPAVDNAYDLGSPTYQWRDVYISSGSLYIDGTKVISSTTQELQITTDAGQSFKILEAGSDTITLQSADGNITLTSSGGGDVIMDPNTGIIALKGTTTIYSGNKIVSSDGNSIQFGNGVAITGSIVATGTNLISGSSQISFTGLSGVPSGIISASAQLDALGYSTTSSFNAFTNSFNAAISLSGTTTTLKGNLIVQGTTTQVDSTTVNISDNIIQLNGTGATNAGLVVRDATSPTLTSGSLLWDTTNDKWIAGTLGSEDDVVLRTATQTLTNKTISGASNTISNIGNSSLTNSSISIAGNSISLGGSISAATILSSTGVISGSAQLPSGTVSGSSQIDLTATTNYSSGIKTRLNAENVLSSSAQVVSALPAGTVSGSSQITFGSISSIPSGLVSGSSQVLAGTTIHSGSFFNGISVVSGSSQVSFNGITDKPALVSGSSQITYSGISSIPSGIVSGSSQITFSGISSIPSGLVSGSSQITFGSISSIPSGLVSGSSQISYSSISSIPSGIVSGSAQLTSTFVQKAGDTMTGLLSVGYSRNDEPFVQSHFYNTSTTPGTQYGGTLVSGISQAHIRFQVGTNTWGASGAKQWQIRVGNGAGEDNMKIYSWTYGNDVLTISSNATATFAGNLSAANLSGTNTGDQTNITGNAGTVTNGVYTTSNNYLSAGNKIVIQNSSDGGSSRGIFMWNGTDPNWGIYMSQAGASKTIADTTAPAGIDGRTEHAIRFRVANSTGQIGFLWENNADVALMQLQPNTGNLYTRGQIYAGNSTSNLVLHTGNYNSYALPLNGGQLNGLVSFSDNAYFTGAPSHGFRWNSANNSFNNVIMRDNGNVEVRGSLIAGSVGSAPQATIQAVGGLRWSTGGNSYYTYTDMDGNGLYIETLDNNTGRAKMRFQTRVNNSGSYTTYQIDANNSQHLWIINGNTRLTMDSSGHILPGANGTQNLGSASLRWNTVFTSDLSLSNGIGDYTIVEGENDLFLYNNKQNKVYKFMLQEVNAQDATPKRPE